MFVFLRKNTCLFSKWQNLSITVVFLNKLENRCNRPAPLIKLPDSYSDLLFPPCKTTNCLGPNFFRHLVFLETGLRAGNLKATLFNEFGRWVFQKSWKRLPRILKLRTFSDRRNTKLP